MVLTRRPVTFVKKSESRLMRFYAWLAKPIVPNFAENFWTTMGHTIYVPTTYDSDPSWGTAEWRTRHSQVIDHECIHVAQAERWGMVVQTLLVAGPAPFLMGIALLLLIVSKVAALIVGALALLTIPLSLGFAWGRWRVEREAYLPSIRAAARRSRAERTERINFVVNTLWTNYGWAWPRQRMRTWFEREAP